MKELLSNIWENKPLKLIMWMAVITRLIAAIFAKGFGMHDDHFLIIEAAQSWVDSYDYNNWLPGSTTDSTPSGHSFFYVGSQYLILLFLKSIGIANPQAKMFIIRILHGLFSLIIVYFGYKITLKLSDEKTAKITGLLLAVFWFMPFLSVRNLVEVVCIPFLIYGIWKIIEHWDAKNAIKYFLLSGFIVGLAFSVRFQTGIFAFGIGLALLIKLRWKEAIFYGIGFLFSVAIVQGGIDYFTWGRPFAELGEYTRYNMAHASNYFTGPWYNYLLLILGVLIPPISFGIFFGFFRSWKKYIILFLPAFLFLFFHSAFPNKQERFILPIVPFVIILGMMGWQDFLNKSSFFNNRKKLIKSFWIFFWVINLLLLPVVSTMYSKRARVESMVYLSQYNDVKAIVLENSNISYVKLAPMFYLGQWVKEYPVTSDNYEEKLVVISKYIKAPQPRFFLFYEEDNLGKRLERVKTIFPNIVYETTISPGFIDKVLHWMNPYNANQTIYIYRNDDYVP
ncbi:MAG: hypothetical protein DRJ05_15890 [Bacteroidetes bacterium]|nr:MAG: hypothetical protein DRJ05_15890 [Bacteroidota bacterium]